MRTIQVVLTAITLLLASSCTERAPLAPYWTEVHGHRFYYERGGAHGGSVHTVLLLHGGGESIKSSFSQQLAVLARNHDVLAVEQVGQGHTPDVAAPLTYAGMLADTVALLDQLHVDRVDAVGWSDGAILALMLAAQHPDRVRRVVASGANFTPDGLTAGEIEDTKQQLAEAEADDRDSFNARLLRMWMTSPTPQELSPESLRKVDKPVLVLAGDHDAIREEHTLALYRLLPKGQLLILPDTGHATFGARPEWLNPILLSFLDGEE